MPKPGEVLFYSNYVFDDGSAQDKLFVVLSSADLECPCLVLKTTSRPERYADASKGCNPKKNVFLVPASWGNCFRVDTYIQLPQIIEIPTKELLEGSFASAIKVISSLSSDCYAQLKSCLKYFRDDIAEQHWKLIFGS